MGTNAAISIDRFRRTRRATQAQAQVVTEAAQAVASMTLQTGDVLGTIARRYGLMSSDETIVVADIVGRSGDLAVADRLAFIAAMERRTPVAVVQVDGWYIACTTDRSLAGNELGALRQAPDAPRLMSLATDRGITPALGPLVA